MTADHSQYIAALLMRSIAHGKRSSENAEEAIAAERRVLEEAKNYLAALPLVAEEPDHVSYSRMTSCD